MTTVLNVPPSLDDKTFETVLEQLAPVSQDEKVLLDARHTRWASPFGLTALLTLAQTRAERPSLYVPESEDTTSYWSRTGFFTFAEELFELAGTVPHARAAGESNVLLEITPVAKSEDVHDVVGRIQQKSQSILVKELNINAKATMGFAMTLSEACQNIVEHAGRGGWVAVQTYRWQKRLGRRVVVIAVCDAGVGFRQSLETARDAHAAIGGMMEWRWKRPSSAASAGFAIPDEVRALREYGATLDVGMASSRCARVRRALPLCRVGTMMFRSRRSSHTFRGHKCKSLSRSGFPTGDQSYRSQFRTAAHRV